MRRTRVTNKVVLSLAAVTIVAVAMLSARTAVWRDRREWRSTAVVTVDGLTCTLCVRRLEDQITKVAGVKTVTVDLARQAAGLTFEEGATVSRDDITAAVRDAGFQATAVDWGKDLNALPMLGQLVIHGTERPACAEDVKRRLRRERGVRSAVVDVEKDATTVVYDPERTTVDHLMRALREGQNACATNQGHPVRDERGTRP